MAISRLSKVCYTHLTLASVERETPRNVIRYIPKTL
jgi:hypothetical protein